MIDTLNKLKECREVEEELYRNIGYKGKLHAILTQCEVGKIYRYIQILRWDEYYSNKRKKNCLDKIRGIYFRRQHNILGIKMGISIPINTFGKGLLIYHSQGIIVHKDSRCGEYCKLHGLNCIGNNGSSKSGDCPNIGNNLDLGVGAKVVGNVKLGEGIIVGCNAVVCETFNENNIVLIGIPAKKMLKKTQNC